jgi:hypothetical protein
MENDHKGNSPEHSALIEPSTQGYHGRLVPLKTTLETRAGETLVDVYITYVPVKLASRVLEYVFLAHQHGNED